MAKNYETLEMFLEALPENDVYSANEQIVRARISLAYEKKNFRQVYNLIKNNIFQNGEDLIEIWNNAHYAEEFERTGKTVSAVKRYRLRERFLPPPSICPKRIPKSPSITSKAVLMQWLEAHQTHPYPSKETKENLVKITNLTWTQVNCWFSNARRRGIGTLKEGKAGRSLPWTTHKRRKDKHCNDSTSTSSTANNVEREISTESKVQRVHEPQCIQAMQPTKATQNVLPLQPKNSPVAGINSHPYVPTSYYIDCNPYFPFQTPPSSSMTMYGSCSQHERLLRPSFNAEEIQLAISERLTQCAGVDPCKAIPTQDSLSSTESQMRSIAASALLELATTPKNYAIRNESNV